VVTANGTNASAVLDGFTITGGNAAGTGDADSAFGGGLLADGGSPTVTNCIFTNNTASNSGGALYASSASPTLTNCLFFANSATQFGGAVYDLGASPTFTNCTFSANTAGMHGGAFENDSSSNPILTNCILWNDTSEFGADEISNDNATFQFGSSVPIVSNSDIDGGYAGTGDINADPLFVDPSQSDFHLQPTSPCINVGTNDAAALSNVAGDLDGNPRIVDGVVDQGAYETQVIGVTWTGQGDGVNWNDPANWSDDLVPTQNDDATVGASFSAVQIQVASGSYAIHSLNSAASIDVIGGSLSLLAPSTIGNSLTLDDGTVDINNGSLTVNYGAAMDPAGMLVGDIRSAYDSGHWDTSGITSSVAAANSALIVGYSDDPVSQTFVMKCAFAGDFNLDGVVNTLDFVLLANNFNHTGSDLAHGDSNYDGNVNALDFNALATNFGATAAPPAGAIIMGLSASLPAARTLFSDQAMALSDTIPLVFGTDGNTTGDDWITA
jgi:predicted outer membrane repeat protein